MVHHICKQYAAARAYSARNFPTFLGRLWVHLKLQAIYDIKLRVSTALSLSKQLSRLRSMLVGKEKIGVFSKHYFSTTNLDKSSEYKTLSRR